MRRLLRHSPLVLLALMLVLQGCSAKKNTAGSRFWQAFTTRYNVYYHGKTNYDEQLKEMEEKYEDDYSQRMLIHPAEARNIPKAPQPTGSFDRTIEKMQKAIALHSIKKKPKRKSGKGNDPKYRAWLKRDEYNPFIHNAWFLLAKAEYMKGEFLDAAATFRYIYRHFTWKPDLVVECQVWEAMCYCALDWPTEADNVLARVHPEKIEDGRVKAMANLAFANYYSRTNMADKAIPYLEQAIGGSKGQQKVRLNFLLGQLYEQTGQKDLAYRAYKAAGSSSGSTYRTKFNARIKQSAVFIGDNIESEVKSLKSMTRYDRNNQYLDQIYYAIGNLYLSRRDTVHAIENYELAAKKSTRNGIDKAISQLTLGGIYFAQHKYDKAQPCYAEGITVVNDDYPNYKMLKRRSDVLDELAVYAQNVTLQDSLLKLSKMTPEEQRKVIKKIIEELKKKEKEEKDEVQRQQYLAKQGAQGNQLGQNKNAPTEFQINTDKSWYFYNTATKNAGKTAFQQAWGNRKLEDDWRRRDKTTFDLGNEEESAGDEEALKQAGDSIAAGGDSIAAAKGDAPKLTKEQQDSVKRAEDPHYEEYYLKQIPKTEEQIQAAHDIIQEGLYNMGVILKDKLEDYDAAALQFATLMERYPENTYRLEVYYNLYLMYMRLDRPELAEQYREKITTEFADSKYGQALQDPLYFAHLKNMLIEQEAMYNTAYNAYLAGNNSVVHGATAEMQSKYPLSKIMPKFMFIDALSYVTEKDYDKFKAVLKEMLEKYPQTDITPVASGIMKNLNAGRQIHGGDRNVRGMLWSTRLSNDSTGGNSTREFTPFKMEDGPQVFVLLYPNLEVSGNMLLYEVARHNFNTFVVKDYDLEQMTFGELGLLVVKGFENFDEVKHYRTIFEGDSSLVLPAQVHPVLISVSNFELLLNEGRSFEDYFNYLEEINDTEHGRLEAEPEQVLTDEEIAAAEREPDDDGDVDTGEKPAKSVRSAKQGPAAVEAAVAAATASGGKADVTQGAWNDVHDVLVKPEPKPVVETEKPETPEKPESSVKSESAENSESSKISENSEDSEKAEAPVTPEASDELDFNEVDPEADARTQAEQRKALEKKAKEEEKARKKAEREAEKQREKEEEERLKAEEEASKQREQAQQERYRSKQLAEQARRDSIANAKKQREEERKLAREQKKKEQEAKRKEREKQRKEREKQRKAERKEKEKARKEAAKQREQERKAREKQREQERKEREKQREQERKEREKQRKNK